MQRKLEPLPGLSNVTGKYTKKCTDEPYPRLFVQSVAEIKRETTGQVNKVKPEITGVHCANTPSAVLSLNSSSSTSQSRQDSAGGSNCLSVAHRTQNTYAPKSQFTAPKSTSAHSSILFSESHTSTGSKIRTHKSSIPIKPQDIPRTKTRMKEVVKSSSSGSVCKLQSKPTGVIIATPCSPLVNEQGLTRSFESFHLNDRVASSNSLGGSEESSHPNSDTTPFVMRKDHGQGMTSGPCNVLSGSYGSGDGDSSAKDQLYDQPCFVQSPCRLNAMKDSPATVNPQCFLKRFSDSQGAYSSDVRQFYNLPGPEYCITNTLNTIPVHAWASKDLINGPSYPHGEQRLCHPGWQEIRDSNEVSRKVSAQLYGLQPRQGSWGIGMSQGTELSASGMPGPQCTQSALEHYLSDLIADEQRFMAGSPCNAFGYSFCGTATGCGNQSSIAASGENGKKTCSIDLLHFLEQRIENALRSMTSFDSKQYIHPSAHVRVRPNRSASLNPVLDSRINSIEFPLPLGNVCQNQPGPDNDDDVQNSSFYENLVNLQNTQCIGSYPSRHFDCAHTESNMLQQFNTDELQYLLKAVKDLVALRTNPSTGTSSSQGQEGSRFGEMDKQKKTIKTERVDTCTISGKDDQSTYGRSGTESPYITRSVSSSRSSSAVRNNRFDTSSESRGSRVSSGVSEDGSHSNADLMHQRLPIGFQHFERYLDSKFGPDRPTNNVSANSSEMQAKPELCAKSTRSSAGHSPSLLSGNLSDHNPQLITRQRAPSSIALHSGINNINTSGASKVGNNTDHSSVPAVSQYPIYFNESSHPFSTTSQSGQTDKNSEERTVATGITCASASSQHGDFIPSSNTVNSHNSGYLPVPSMNCASSYTGSPEGNISHMNCYTDSSNTHCSDPQAGQVTPWPPNWYQCRFSSCIPRSGSANAGFTYSLETDNSSNHAADRGIAPEFERFRQNNNRWDNYYVGNGNTQISMPSEQTTDLQNFIHYNNNNVLQTPALRPMTNSFSANDLAAYHSQSRIGIRYTKSSFDLAPELPVEPGLALSDHSNFYSKISSLIEMDNDVRLILPNGWSERRSSLGRSYYTCDSTRRSTWNHPLVGPWIPLGWERVDSSQAGVYYQNLLIPHCQRHHPNLWISSLLKDPEVERKSFFTDLRKLQLSLRHSLSACHAEVGAYKNANTEQEQYFINRFRHLKLESLMEIIYSLDQLFYQDLHILIVSFEQERMSIVSHMFAIQPPERTFPQFTES
ncbi:unnamed protein product [Heterobilharzia americana]|nr:unnamed protein product [Heterobilharzia americana]